MSVGSVITSQRPVTEKPSASAQILDLIDKIGDDLELKYSSRPRTNHPIEYGKC